MHWKARNDLRPPDEYRMLLTGSLIVAGIAVLLVRSFRLARHMEPAALGWMSERWIAEHRSARHV